jgi:predicted Zn-dependent protease
LDQSHRIFGGASQIGAIPIPHEIAKRFEVDPLLDLAEEMIRRALKAEPQSAAYMDSLGWVMYKEGRFEESVKVLEEAVHAAPALDPVLWDHLGDAYWKANRRDDAVKAWQEAAKLIEAAGADAKPDEAHRVQEKVEKSKAGGEPPVAPVPPK